MTLQSLQTSHMKQTHKNQTTEQLHGLLEAGVEIETANKPTWRALKRTQEGNHRAIWMIGTPRTSISIERPLMPLTPQYGQTSLPPPIEVAALNSGNYGLPALTQATHAMMIAYSTTPMQMQPSHDQSGSVRGWSPNRTLQQQPPPLVQPTHSPSRRSSGSLQPAQLTTANLTNLPRQQRVTSGQGKRAAPPSSSGSSGSSLGHYDPKTGGYIGNKKKTRKQ